jgi:hypothetical protein
MFKPIKAIFYFCVWVNGNWTVQDMKQEYHNSISCQATTNVLITNEDILEYMIRKEDESVSGNPKD